MLRFVWLAAGRSDFTFVRLGIYVCAGAHREHGTGAVTATARAAAHTHPPTEAQSGAHTPNVTQRTIYRRVIATAGSATPSQCPEPGGLSAIPAQAARSVSVTRPGPEPAARIVRRPGAVTQPAAGCPPAGNVHWTPEDITSAGRCGVRRHGVEGIVL